MPLTIQEREEFLRKLTEFNRRLLDKKIKSQKELDEYFATQPEDVVDTIAILKAEISQEITEWSEKRYIDDNTANRLSELLHKGQFSTLIVDFQSTFAGKVKNIKEKSLTNAVEQKIDNVGVIYNFARKVKDKVSNIWASFKKFIGTDKSKSAEQFTQSKDMKEKAELRSQLDIINDFVRIARKDPLMPEDITTLRNAKERIIDIKTGIVHNMINLLQSNPTLMSDFLNQETGLARALDERNDYRVYGKPDSPPWVGLEIDLHQKIEGELDKAEMRFVQQRQTKVAPSKSESEVVVENPVKKETKSSQEVETQRKEESLRQETEHRRQEEQLRKEELRKQEESRRQKEVERQQKLEEKRLRQEAESVAQKREKSFRESIKDSEIPPPLPPREDLPPLTPEQLEALNKVAPPPPVLEREKELNDAPLPPPLMPEQLEELSKVAPPPPVLEREKELNDVPSPPPFEKAPPPPPLSSHAKILNNMPKEQPNRGKLLADIQKLRKPPTVGNDEDTLEPVQNVQESPVDLKEHGKPEVPPVLPTVNDERANLLQDIRAGKKLKSTKAAQSSANPLNSIIDDVENVAKKKAVGGGSSEVRQLMARRVAIDEEKRPFEIEQHKIFLNLLKFSREEIQQAKRELEVRASKASKNVKDTFENYLLPMYDKALEVHGDTKKIKKALDGFVERWNEVDSKDDEPIFSQEERETLVDLVKKGVDLNSSDFRSLRGQLDEVVNLTGPQFEPDF